MTVPEPLTAEEYWAARLLATLEAERAAHAADRERIAAAVEALPCQCDSSDGRCRTNVVYRRAVLALLRTPAATDPLAPPAPAGELDVEALMIAVFNADRPGDWPTWEDYIAAFGSPGTPPWRRKAEAIAAEYARLTAEPTPEPES
jgi:hypothetical protein